MVAVEEEVEEVEEVEAAEVGVVEVAEVKAHLMVAIQKAGIRMYPP